MTLTRRELLRTATLGGVGVATNVGLAGCAGGGGEENPTATATATGTEPGTGTTTGGGATGTAEADKTIVMKDTVFRTVKAAVDAGATVRWINEDSFEHTVTSTTFHDAAASWDFDAQVAGGGATSYTFEEKGVYEYYCTIHGESSMCGAVLVGGATLEESLPCEGGGDY